MAKTFIIDWPVLIFIGVLFGALSPGERWWRSRAFIAGLLTAGAFTVVAMVSYGIAPDWMWMYFLDPSRVAWVLPFMPLVYLSVFALGFAATISLKALGSPALLVAAAAAVAMEIVLIAITWERYHLVGTRAQWLQGTAHELLSLAPTGPAKSIALMSPVFFVVLVASLVVLRREIRQAISPYGGRGVSSG